MHPFVFRPFCVISEPQLDCSDGWAMYQYIAIFAAIGYRRWEASLLILAALLTWFYAFKRGLPGLEATYHFGIGSLLGVYILFLSKSPKLVELRTLQNYTGILSYLFIIIIGSTSFIDIDERILESNARYGVVGAFILVLAWTLVFAFAIYQFNGISKQSQAASTGYWKMWQMFVGTLTVIMTTALCGAIGGYLKGLMVLILAPMVIHILK